MLQRLIIRNYAIIDEIEIEFNDGLNIITGETGAGKSIILGALGLIKGERAQSQMMRSADKKCVIEAIYDVSNYPLQDWFVANNLMYSSQAIVRREINSDGKSKAFINNGSCNVNLLQELGDKLIEIHSQHDSLELKSNDFQLDVIDAFADNSTYLQDIKSNFSEYKALQREYDILIHSQSKSQAEKDLQQYHLTELNAHDFELWNLEQLENEYSLMENSLEIKQSIGLSVSNLKDDEINLLDSLKEILNRMRKFEKVSKDLESINEELDASIDKINQISRDYESLADNIDFDEEKLIELRDKVDFINKMLKKHGKQTIAELAELKDELATALNYTENLSEKITELEFNLTKKYTSCIAIAKTISDRRKKLLPTIEKNLLTYLYELQLDSSQFQIELESNEKELTEKGIDKVEFLFTANAGSPLRELKRAISGGEMSRFMLAIKSLIAQKINLPTLIFDEIDTGVSGPVANKVATNLQNLATKHQIIAITHLPQIASRGSYHLWVYKETQNNITQTRLKKLSQSEREFEIAKMISGEEITENSLVTARELLR
jgi:DNA repair protein RecN (Recombination protein N)